MKRIVAALALLVSCGYSSVDSELMGQVKKVVNNTPLICPRYASADISLGVMRNGVGSMSTADVWVYVPNPTDIDILKRAAETGELVKVKYDVARVVICTEDHVVSKVEIVK